MPGSATPGSASSSARWRRSAAASHLHTSRGARAGFAQARSAASATPTCMQGEPRQACPILRQAFTIANESNLQRDAAVWAGNVAAANIELGEWNEAERFNDEARALRTATRTGNLSTTRSTRRRSPRAAAAGRGGAPLRRSAGRTPGCFRACAGRRTPGSRASRSRTVEAGRGGAHFEAALETIEKTRAEVLKTEYKLSFLTRLI